ncbi:hypothetical protein [Sorangium sp. So ce341]|uniref:hypothetical protein n=1 Tax=Sorangium sp. So ce341 TaxID=3133302 RepID=UPI003F5D7E83
MTTRDEIRSAGGPGGAAATTAITPEVPFQPVPGPPAEPAQPGPGLPGRPAPEVPTPPGRPGPEILPPTEPGREVPHHPEPSRPGREAPHEVPPAPDKGPPVSPEVPTPPGQPRPEILVRRASAVRAGAAP